MSLSLEEAICKAKVKVEIDESTVILEREKLNEARSLAAPTTRIGTFALQHVNSDDQNLSYETKFWKEKCSALLHERNQIEETMTRKLSEVLGKFEHLSQYVHLLELKNAGLNTKATPKTTESSSLELCEEKLRVYELLTSTSIEKSSESEFICTTKNPLVRKATRFTLQKVEHPDGDILVHPKGNVRLLPEYLQQGDIVCESATVPVLMADVLQTLYKEDEV